MKPGFRARHFIWSIAIFGVCVGGVTYYLATTLDGNLCHLTYQQVRRHAESLARALTPNTAELPANGPDETLALYNRKGKLIARRGKAHAADNADRLAELRIADQPAYRLFKRGERAMIAVFAPGNRVLVHSQPILLAKARAELKRALIVVAVAAFVVLLLTTVAARRLFSRTISQLVHSVYAAAGEAEQTGLGEYDIGQVTGSVTRIAGQLNSSVATLASERSRFEAVLNAMSEAVVTTDSALTITLANPAACELLRAELGTVIGVPLIEVTRLPALNDLVHRGLKEDVSAEIVFGNQERTVAARVKPLGGAGTVIAMHDITEQRRLEVIRRDFVANVSHELRTPVSVMRANAETLLDGALDERDLAERFVTAILRNAERLSQLVSDLLDLARVEAGRLTLEIVPVAISEVAQRVLETVAPAADKRNMELVDAVPAGLRVSADRKALEQVLLNLLDNAVKYVHEGGRIEITAQAVNAKVRIEVRDNGPGIAPHHRARIFERFFRVDPGRSREMGGTGLGLAIVRHLVDTMGGEVGVDALRPSGAAFWISLPSATAR
ncbi:MAG: PAS domain-containing protein [Deltaproteobacteria bacterium]|nr:PAS domain-containing protein [Deltaproteobacteria bacterium]